MEGLIISAVVVGISLAVGIAVYHKGDDDTALDRSIDDKLNELPLLYQQAHQSIKIATDFDPRFFDDERVKGAIEKALENGVEVKFLSEEEPPEWYKNRSAIITKQVPKLPRHLMIIDGYSVRIEKPHEKLKFGKEDDIAIIFKGFPRLAERCDQEFERAWGR